jgi:hypothetical protein
MKPASRGREATMQRRSVLGVIAGLALALAGAALPALAGIVPETLQDGTKIEIDGEKVYVIRAGDGSVRPAGDGSVKPADTRKRVPAADGSYKLKNGKTIEVKNGKLVAKP